MIKCIYMIIKGGHINGKRRRKENHVNSKRKWSDIQKIGEDVILVNMR